MATAGETVSGGLIFGTIISKAAVKHKKHKINELDFAVLCIRLTSSQTSGLFLSDKNFSTTGSLFSRAAFRKRGASTGSV